MSKVKTIKPNNYVCNNCGSSFSTWSGRCERCGEWNTLELRVNNPLVASKSGLAVEPISRSITTMERRINSGIASVDLVFGGGLVEGSVSLLSGEPGMGKSTFLLQLASAIAKNDPVLYVSGEESVHQLAARAKRLGADQHAFNVASNNSAEDIAGEILSSKYKLVIVDSIQTLRSEQIGSTAGSVTQVTSSSALLSSAAKQSNTALLIVGHVTKDGNIAGPKLLEHAVDTVLSLEGDPRAGLKLLRVNKNRFGSTNETAIFEMRSNGLIPVLNPSALLLAERQVSDGSIVLAAMEGSRPILVEVQALVNPTSYGYPKRAASGLDLGRLNLLLAMLERRTKLKLGDKDVYLNIVGGIKISEPAADLAVVMAIASAAKAKQLKANAVVFGEVGLSGEVRHVPNMAKRITEAKQLGFDYAIGPQPLNAKSTPLLHPVKDVLTALNSYLS